jgi:hypothetical protein
MNEKNRATPWKYEVRGTGQSLVVESEPKPVSMQKATNDDLRLRVLLLDGSHHLASLLRGDAPDHHSLMWSRVEYSTP